MTRLLFAVIAGLFALGMFSQTLPTCPSNIVYLHNSPIQAYNTTLPIGPGNPSSTGIPSGGGGLALMPNLNAATPNPTFYTIISNTINYWNGTAWVSTGHSAGNTSAVNLGGGGCYLYNLVGSTGQVYVYNGTGPATLLTTLPSFSGGGPYDICCDANGNWYILKTTTPQSMTMYSPAGAVLATYNMTGMPSTSAGGGFAIVGGTVYVSNSAGFFTGTITGTTVAFTNNASASGSMSAGDYASCPGNSTVSSFTSNAVASGTLGCSTTSVPLTANTNISPVNSYSWTGPGLTGPTTNSTAIATAAGVYSCVITKTVCPSTTTVVTVTITSNGSIINPMITASNTLTCAQPSAQLTVTPGPPGYNYMWTGPGIVGAANVSVITVNQPGTYTAAVFNQTNTCQGSQTLTVISNTVPPMVNSTPSSTSICFGQSATLIAAGAVTYTWNTGPTGTNLMITPPSTSSYTVSGTGTNGCVASAVSTVSVIALPTPNGNSNSPICAGTNLNLLGSGGQIYMWMGPNSFTSVLQNPVIANVSTAATGIYTLMVMNGACTATTTINVNINPLPTPIANNNGPVCEGNPISFTGSGGVFYSWNGPAGFQSNSSTPSIAVPSAASSGAYTVSVTDGNGCTNTTVTNAIINAPPAISTSGSTVCANQNIVLGATGGTIYSWTGPNGFSSSAQNPVIPMASQNMAGIYFVTVTDANNCSSSSNTVVVVNPIPTPIALNNGPVCIGDQLSFSGNGGLNYSWNGPNGYFSNLQNPAFLAGSSNMSGNYTLTVSDNIGCTSSISTPVTVNALPSPSITSGNNKGCVPICVTFTVQNSTALQNATWDFGDGGSNAGSVTSECYSHTGNYTVTASVTDMNGCKNSTTYLVEVYPIPIADFNWAPIKPIVNQDEVDFTDASHGATVAGWNWYFTSQTGHISIEQHPTFYYAEAGSYPVTLVVKSDKGCADTIMKTIIVGEDYGLYVPNAFTPNGDGLNDVFQPKGFGIVEYELDIYDRWGERIFHTNDFNQGWDGIRQKKNDISYGVLKDDIYTWRIQVINVFSQRLEFTGHVTLMK
jgi:gliding motility-associated-like protein